MRRLTLRLLWDLFMVWVAFANLCLILFDLTYLQLRPFYYRQAPVITRVYDPVKGIVPHPLTRQLLAEVCALDQLLLFGPAVPELPARVGTLRRLTKQMLEENPFEQSGQTRALRAITVLIAQQLGRSSSSLRLGDQQAQLVAAFWSDDPQLLGQRLRLFRRRAGPLLAVHYYRELDTSGRLVDHFWLLDLPFLALFWAEFVSCWALAVSRRRHARWFFFPIFHWYDLLGLVPSAYFRPLRLLRIASIYLRLRHSKLSRVGDDIISRTVAYVSNIITEEVSDMVSLRILQEYQEEIREGTHRRIFEQTIGTRRQEIDQVVARQIRDVLTNRESLQHFRELLRLNLESAVDSSQALRSLPLPSALLKPVVRAVGEVVLDATVETVTSTIDSEQGQELTQALVGSVLDQLITGPGLAELDSIVSEIGLDIFEHMKETVAVKKWAQPRTEPREELQPGPETGEVEETAEHQEDGAPG